MLDLTIALSRNLSPLALVALAYSLTLRQDGYRLHAVLVGALFGLGSVVALLDPIEIRPGVLVDSRTTPIVLAGYFAGPVAGLLSAAIAAAVRLHLGGVGAFAGCVVIAISAAIGLLGHRHLRGADGRTSLPGLFILALLSPLAGLGIFALPWQIALPLFGEAVIPLALMRAIGTLALGAIMLQDHARAIAERRAHAQARTDELSGLPNRRAFFARLNEEAGRRDRYETPFSVLLIDIDRFKSINDTYGHSVGDEVIRRLAGVLEAECRSSDLPGRIGGEEFAVLLANTDQALARSLAERLRQAAAHQIVATDKGPLTFTVSIGIGSDRLQGRRPEAIMTAADDALYVSKNTGRNRVSVGVACA